MRGRLAKIANTLILVLAALIPWGAYQYVPHLHTQASTLVAMALAALLTVDAALSRRLRLPFELAWPVGLAVLATLPLPFIIRGGASPGLLVPLLFAATLHFSRSPRITRSAFAILGLSAASMAAVTLLLPKTGLIPPTWAAEWAKAPAFARSTLDGLFLMALCTCAMLALRPPGTASRLDKTGLLFWVAAAILVGSAAILLTGHVRVSTSLSGLFQGQMGQAPSLAPTLLLLWLSARVVAKAAIWRRVRFHPLHATAIAVAAVTAFRLILVPSPLDMCYSFALALAAATAVPTKRPFIEQHRPALPSALILFPAAVALIVLNLFRVDPANPLEPRNYTYTAQRLMQQGEFARIVELVAAIQADYPEERMTHFWHAQANLSAGNPYRAAREFALSVIPPQGRLLMPLPSPAQCTTFLGQLRDHCSSHPHPEQSFAFEMALAAAGKTQEAIDLLRFQASRTLEREPAITPPPGSERAMRQAVLWLLGDGPISGHLQEWTDKELFALLRNWSTRTSDAENALPGELTPLICIARQGEEGPECAIFAGVEHQEKVIPQTQSATAPQPQAWDAGGWQAPAQDAGGLWHITLTGPQGGQEVFKVTLGQGQGIGITALPSPASLPDSPAIRLWLPPSQHP